MGKLILKENCNICGSPLHYHKPTETADFSVAVCLGKNPTKFHGKQTFLLDDDKTTTEE